MLESMPSMATVISSSARENPRPLDLTLVIMDTMPQELELLCKGEIG